MLTRRVKNFLAVNSRRIIKSSVNWIGRNQELSFITAIAGSTIFTHFFGFEPVFWFLLGVIITLAFLAVSGNDSGAS